VRFERISRSLGERKALKSEAQERRELKEASKGKLAESSLRG